MMKISVVILNWNRPQDTLRAVDSVLRQDYEDFEVLVWDNASTDGSADALRQALDPQPRVRLRMADANYGVAGGRNRAFPETTGDIILSLDSDAWFESTSALSLLAGAFSRDATIGAVSFEVKRPDGHLMWPFSRSASEWRHRSFETLRVDGCAFATRRDIFKRAAGFPEHYSPYGAEDQHYAFTVIGMGYKVLYMPEIVVIHAFATTGRTQLQFARHVRNSLWIPMELFPVPHAFLSIAMKKISLARDAVEQKQLAGYIRGLFNALLGFRPSHRHPISKSGWHRIRELVSEDKRLKKTPATEST